ncbi:MAG TPA: histidinol-phosphate transaminase [Steroidobacteraceae bacterium]|nr:histidinol-phosphate transaminase [Steroidobacteraceae bacterium]
MSFDVSKLAAQPVLGIAPYVPGKPLEELEREYGIRDSIKLASNENPLGPGPKAREAMRQAVDAVGLYPDGNGFALKQALAKKHGCDIACITLGNGSNDVLVMLAEAFLTPATEAIYSQYGFAVYPISIQATGATARISNALPANDSMPLGHDLGAMRALINERTRLVFIANPNNPTGTWLSADALEQFVRSAPRHVIVVVDEAYIEYAGGEFADASKWLGRYPNLVVTRTFSKAYGLAGLRVGYALSDPQIANVLNRVRQAFNVNSVALAAARAALDDSEHLQKSVAVNTAGLAQLRSALAKLPVSVLPSAGNFLLIDCGRPAAPIYEAMLRQGVIVRPVGNYGLPNHLRVTVGTAEQNERMVAAFAHALRAT